MPNRLNKNKKSKKKSKSKATKPLQLRRIDELVFNNASRVDFVTGFRRRKQQRRIKAAKELIEIEKEQKRDFRREKIKEENSVLIKGGYLQDPISEFLYDSDDSDISSNNLSNDNDNNNTIKVANLGTISLIDMFNNGNNDNSGNNNNNNNNEIGTNKYENDELITTVVTSIPTKIGDVDEDTLLLNKAKEFWEIEKQNNENNNNDKMSLCKDNEKFDNNAKIHAQSTNSNNNNNTNNNNNNNNSNNRKIKLKIDKNNIDGPISIEDQRRERKKLKKMLHFVKEFNRKKKRKANSKHRKHKPKKKKNSKK